MALAEGRMILWRFSDYINKINFDIQQGMVLVKLSLARSSCKTRQLQARELMLREGEGIYLQRGSMITHFQVPLLGIVQQKARQKADGMVDNQT
jgi:hypothetical protein